MAANPEIILLGSSFNPATIAQLEIEYQIHRTEDFSLCESLFEDQEIKIIGIDISKDPNLAFDSSEKLKGMSVAEGVQMVFFSASDDLQDKIHAMELGCDDYILHSIQSEELVARFHNIIMHKIANEQLLSRVRMANDMAHMAMSNTSELGVSMQFHLDSSRCENLDELGALFFKAVDFYHSHCSIQMRSDFSVKNMESNGMAKNLESQLLGQLKGMGRFYDFGSRTVVNYDSVSVLVKNMPSDDAKYGSLKDNLFSLVQGVDARVKAIDNKRSLEIERDLMNLLSEKLQTEMANIDNSYQSIMLKIVHNVESLAVKIERAMMHLGLTEEQESTIVGFMEECVIVNDKVFTEGLHIDESLRILIEELNTVFGEEDEGRKMEKVQSLLQTLSS